MNTALLILFTLLFFASVIFVVFMFRKGKLRLIHWLYFAVTVTSVITLLDMLLLIILRNVSTLADDSTTARIIDAVSNVGLFLPVLSLLVSLTFTRGWEKLPKWSWALFIVPLLAFILVWTNPFHHTFYKAFSINRSKLGVGPCLIISGVYSYICFILAIGIVAFFSFNKKNAAYRKQGFLLVVGTITPMIVSMLATLATPALQRMLDDYLIYFTPLSYSIGLVIFNGLAIFRFNLLDIRPLAMETILNRISDCYLVVNENGLIVSYNRAFKDTFGTEYKLKMYSNIYDHASNADTDEDIGFHTLIASIASCKDAETAISYEQSLIVKTDGIATQRYYMIDITGLSIRGKNVGFVIIFKDISRLKENDRELHNSQIRLMEHKQLAVLGQTLGGISHNLKTPIMSISGSCNAVSNLVEEATVSLKDNEVTKQDYAEIYSEINQWIAKIHEACSYMSDIITAVKGQATNFNTNTEVEFSIEDVVKRVTLLLRHEFLKSNCVLKVNNFTPPNVRIFGDINSMVQVINNLIINSLYAMRETGGEIEFEVDMDEENLLIKVKDRGTGVPEDVKKVLFQQMVTSKGAMGSGIGVFMSKTVIKARFDGKMWFEDNPGGGAIFALSIPRSKIELIEEKTEIEK